MPCYHPMDAWQTDARHPSGKRVISFSYNPKFDFPKIKLPCGQCVGCRLERSRQWAMRCTHEAQLYKNNCFITLTYDNDHLPDDGSLHVDHYQDFMKRFRFHYSGIEPVVDSDGKTTYPIRFFHCGEYGETFGRPHYHACIFNFDFDDRVLYKITNGVRLYKSQKLSDLWGKGFVTVGDVTFQSAAYVARYIMKKITGDAADDHYMDPVTGVFKKPEYTTMSRRPGIGKGWFDKYTSDVYPSDFVVLNGKKMRPPKYYDSQYEIIDPMALEGIKHGRYLDGQKHIDNNSPERLAVREEVLLRKLKQLPRNLD